jgi:hypothetical protein
VSEPDCAKGQELKALAAAINDDNPYEDAQHRHCGAASNRDHAAGFRIFASAARRFEWFFNAP